MHLIFNGFLGCTVERHALFSKGLDKGSAKIGGSYRVERHALISKGLDGPFDLLI